jgi:L-fuconolactonase
MEVVDAQLHEPGPFTAVPDAPELRRQVFTEMTLASMDAAGVDAAVLFPVGDETWAEQMVAAYNGKFALVIRIRDVEQPDLEEEMGRALEKPGLVAFRFLTWNPASPNPIEVERAKLQADIDRGKFDRGMAFAAAHDRPVFIYANGMLAEAHALAKRYPQNTLIVDHLGIMQSPMETPEDPRFRSLPALLDLAAAPNVAVKLCGLPGLSTEAYPFADAVRPLRAIADAYGADRLMWASDIWRFRGRIGSSIRLPSAMRPFPGRHTYAESVDFIKRSPVLTEAEKIAILGGTARQILRWQLDQTAEPYLNTGSS